ncbi:MAG: hypothetical protein R3344_04620 [Acidobacteriota bacterium]|nr:hypothetical protein [Acidobacteriota bacterium]
MTDLGPPYRLRKPRYDKAFEPAVRAGTLTVAEAVRRGSRDVYALRLMERYKLSRPLAIAVTDNRARLFDVLRKTGRIPGAPAPQGGLGRSGRLQVWTAVIGVVALIALFGTHQWQRQTTIGRQLEKASLSAVRNRPVEVTAPSTTTPSQRPGARVGRDDAGHVISVSARNPIDALSALCDAIPGRECRIMEVVPTQPPFPGKRLGIYASILAPEQTRTVAIQRDGQSGRWLIRAAVAPRGSERQSECEANDGSDCL